MTKFELSPAVLWRLGYRHLTTQQANDALNEIYEALQIAVGARLVALMNKRQLEEYETLMNGPEERALAWLEENLSSYKQVVADEYDVLQRRLEGAIALARRQQKDELTSGGSR